jgi:NAD(P)H-hydrate repair Nnr-like enzyme with NAD(P)H-hydrate dehydratase domain
MASTNSFVVGPGLGRHEESLDLFTKFIQSLAENDQPIKVVFDADSLWHIKQEDQLRAKVAAFTGKIVLTPNAMEFKRLQDAYMQESLVKSATLEQELEFIDNNDDSYGKIDINHPVAAAVAEMSN